MLFGSTFVTFRIQPSLRSSSTCLWSGVAFVWIASVVFAIPGCIIYDTYHIPDEPEIEYCHPVDSDMDRTYTIFKTILMFFLPLLIIFAAYTGQMDQRTF